MNHARSYQNTKVVVSIVLIVFTYTSTSACHHNVQRAGRKRRLRDALNSAMLFGLLTNVLCYSRYRWCCNAASPSRSASSAVNAICRRPLLRRENLPVTVALTRHVLTIAALLMRSWTLSSRDRDRSFGAVAVWLLIVIQARRDRCTCRDMVHVMRANSS